MGATKEQRIRAAFEWERDELWDICVDGKDTGRTTRRMREAGWTYHDSRNNPDGGVNMRFIRLRRESPAEPAS